MRVARLRFLVFAQACRDCLRGLAPTACPQCAAVFDVGRADQFPPYSRAREREVLLLEVRCPLGCAWQGPLRDAVLQPVPGAHAAVCPGEEALMSNYLWSCMWGVVVDKDC